MPIKRKISKRKTKTRRNCGPCMGALNPSRKGVRRRNPRELEGDDNNDGPNRAELIEEAKAKLKAIDHGLSKYFWYSYEQLERLNKKLIDFI